MNIQNQSGEEEKMSTRIHGSDFSIYLHQYLLQRSEHPEDSLVLITHTISRIPSLANHLLSIHSLKAAPDVLRNVLSVQHIADKTFLTNYHRCSTNNKERGEVFSGLNGQACMVLHKDNRPYPEP